MQEKGLNYGKQWLWQVYDFCVAYTKCKPLNAIAEDIYSCICHGEQNGCHVVYCGRR